LSALRAIWTNVFELLVEDGSIAIGTLVAFAVAAVWAAMAGEALRPLAGPLLLVLLMALLLGNLYRAARR
jgi:hypothetical protein